MKKGLLILTVALMRSEEHTPELQSPCNLVCRLLLEKKKKTHRRTPPVPTHPPPIPSPQPPGPGAVGTAAVSRAESRGCRAATACLLFFFFFNDTATTEIYTLSLHDALPISQLQSRAGAMAHFWPSLRRRS